MVFYTYDYSSHTGDHLLCSLSPALAYKLFLISSILRGMSRCFQVAPSVFSQGTGRVCHDFLLCIVPTCLAAPTPLTPFIRQGFCLELAVKRKMASALRCWDYRRVVTMLVWVTLSLLLGLKNCMQTLDSKSLVRYVACNFFSSYESFLLHLHPQLSQNKPMLVMKSIPFFPSAVCTSLDVH